MKLYIQGVLIEKTILNKISELATQSFFILEKAWKSLEVTLVDFKVIFFTKKNNNILFFNRLNLELLQKKN